DPDVGGLWLLMQREEACAPNHEPNPHQHGGDRVPAHCALQQRCQPEVRSLTSSDAAIRMELQVRSLVSGDLQNHERETKLKDSLKGDQAPQRVVVTLLGCRQEMHDQQ